MYFLDKSVFVVTYSNKNNRKVIDEENIVRAISVMEKVQVP